VSETALDLPKKSVFQKITEKNFKNIRRGLAAQPAAFRSFERSIRLIDQQV
jgi:hypothetical protein